MIRGAGKGKGKAFDLVGSCIGIVPLDKVIVGERIRAGDLVVGLRSTGIHSNGLSLARKIFFKKLGWEPGRYVPELERTIADELLEPTRIYVREVLDMLGANLAIKALAHITSDGFLNLTRVTAKVGFVLDSIPEPHAIFSLIQSAGNVQFEEMFRVYNMGIGFCVVVAPEDASRVQAISRHHDCESYIIGRAVADSSKQISLPKYNLIGRDGRFWPA
jgi:phosphoribosylformylglycinamidine cyclo-ligase